MTDLGEQSAVVLDLQEVSSSVAAELHQIRVKNVGERIELYRERFDAARAEDLVVLDFDRHVPVVETDEDVRKADRRPVSRTKPCPHDEGGSGGERVARRADLVGASRDFDGTVDGRREDVEDSHLHD